MRIQSIRKETEKNIVAEGIMIIICAGIGLLWALWYLANNTTL